MNKQLNTLFLKQLIDLDFPFVKTSIKENKNNNKNIVLKRFNLNTKNKFHILELFKLNNSLKQFIRILYSIKYQYRKKYKRYQETPFLIYIWCANKFIVELVQIFIDSHGLSSFAEVNELFPTIDRIEHEEKQKFLFVLGDPWTERAKQMLSARVLYSRIFLVNTVTFQRDKPNLGLFKIQNDLSDYKKLIVLLVIIDKIVGEFREMESS